MKILWATQTDFSKNLDIATYREIALELKQLGNEIKLLLPSFENGEISSLEGLDVALLPYPRKRFLSGSLFQLSLFFYLLFNVVFKGYDLVILDHYCVFAILPLNILAKLKLIKTRFVLDIRCFPVVISLPVGILGFQDKIHLSRLKIALYLSKYLCDGFTVITLLYRDKIAENYGIEKERIGIWTSGVSLGLFNPEYVEDLRRKFELENKFVIMYHGVLSLSRGLLEAINAIKLLRDEIPELSLFLLGRGDAVDELKRFVADNKLEDNVIIHEPVEYRLVPNFIDICDVGLLPLPDILLWRMSSPLKLMEYLAMRKPIILTNIEAHNQVIKGSKCGIFINSCKPSDIKNGILRAYKMREDLKEIGYSGRELVEKEYSWEKQAKKLHEYLKKIKE